MSPELTVDDVEAIAHDVWMSFAGADGDLPVEPCRPPDSPAEPRLRSQVEVEGAWTGRVALELSPTAAAALTARMLGQHPVTRADVADATGELANMVGGNIKSLMPAPSRLGLPTVTWPGETPATSVPDRAALLTAELDWAGEPIRILVWDLGAPHKEVGTL